MLDLVCSVSQLGKEMPQLFLHRGFCAQAQVRGDLFACPVPDRLVGIEIRTIARQIHQSQAQLWSSQVGTHGITAMGWGIVPEHDQSSGVLFPQLLQESGRGLGVTVPFQLHKLHFAGLQAHRRVIAGLFAPPGAGRIYQRWLSFEYPFPPQVRIRPEMGLISEEDLAPPPVAPRPGVRHTPPRRLPAWPRRPSGNVSSAVSGQIPTGAGSSGNCCGSARARSVLGQTYAPLSSSNSPGLCLPFRAAPVPQPSVGPAGPRRGRGGATRLFEAKGRGTSVAEGSDPRADGVGIPFQRLGYRRRSPALGQKPESMPPFPLPRCWRSIHAFSQVTYIQLPPFKKFHYVPHTQHHRHSTSLTEYRNSSAGLALCSFHLGISLGKDASPSQIRRLALYLRNAF